MINLFGVECAGIVIGLMVIYRMLKFSTPLADRCATLFREEDRLQRQWDLTHSQRPPTEEECEAFRASMARIHTELDRIGGFRPIFRQVFDLTGAYHGRK